jgi:hypothetical protein
MNTDDSNKNKREYDALCNIYIPVDYAKMFNQGYHKFLYSPERGELFVSMENLNVAVKLLRKMLKSDKNLTERALKLYECLSSIKSDHHHGIRMY